MTILSHVQTKVRSVGSREGKTEQRHREKQRCQEKVRQRGRKRSGSGTQNQREWSLELAPPSDRVLAVYGTYPWAPVRSLNPRDKPLFLSSSGLCCHSNNSDLNSLLPKPFLLYLTTCMLLPHRSKGDAHPVPHGQLRSRFHRPSSSTLLLWLPSHHHRPRP